MERLSSDCQETNWLHALEDRGKQSRSLVPKYLCRLADLDALGADKGGDTAAAEPFHPEVKQFAFEEKVSASTRFQILRFHDSGGLGEVFLARDEAMGREVALKRIKKQNAVDPRAVPDSW